MTAGDMLWTEEDSRGFIDRGAIFTPGRDEIRDVILELIPAEPDESFLAVELGVGAGWLSHAVLARFPRARIIGLDGSPVMLQETENRLGPFAGRFELRRFRLEDPSWLDGLTEPIRCFISSLVVHHLDGPGKQKLYAELYRRLDPMGAVIIADLVAPRSEWERRYLANAWDAAVERQSREATGSDEIYREFLDSHWNYYRYPDPVDIPSAVPEHLAWLEEAGFQGANVFWERAGHTVYGGYRSLGLDRRNVNR
jgi:tRNA (cmo5U34)-methyltransferase